MNVNKHISEYIKNNYLNSAIPPQFAVLVKGDWGCGKTFLVKKILEEKYGKEDWKKNVVWISVYGLSTIQELKQKIIEELILLSFETDIEQKSSKFKTILGRFTNRFTNWIKPLISFGNSIINSIFKSRDIDVNSFKELFYPYLIRNNIQNKLLVIDDIERSSIQISEIFGFCSEYIVNENVKAIFIFNETKLQDEEKCKTEKEKIIGMEFEVQPDTPAAIKKFISKIGLSEYETILLEKSISVLENLKCKNLRSVRQAFVHISNILNILNKKNKNVNKDYISEVVEYFLVVFVQKASGKINTENEFINAIGVYKNYKQSLEVYNKKHDEKDTNLPIFYAIDRIPLKNLYFNIIQQGDFSTESILADYKRFTELDKKLTPLQKLTDWPNLSDKDFEKCYKSVEDDFDKNKILNQIDIVRWAEMKFRFSHFGIIDESIENIKKYIIDYITRNKNKLKPVDPNLSLISPLFDIKNAKPLLDEIIAQLKQINHDLLKDGIKEQFEQLYSNLPEKMSELDYFICGYDGKTLDVPILSLLDNIKDFYQKIKKLDYSSQSSIFRSFEVRYERNGGQTKCFQDIGKIKEISELYGKDVGDLKMSPKNVGNKWLSASYEKLYCRMKEIKADTNADKNNAN